MYLLQISIPLLHFTFINNNMVFLLALALSYLYNQVKYNVDKTMNAFFANSLHFYLSLSFLVYAMC